MKQTIFNIRIGCFDYDIKNTPTTIIHGEWSGAELHLCVNFNLPKHKILHTFIHEITHAIDDVYNMPDDNDLEDRADLYATAWLQIYRDNPEFLKFIQKNLK